MSKKLKFSLRLPTALLAVLAATVFAPPARADIVREFAYCPDGVEPRRAVCNVVRRTLLDDFDRPNQSGIPGPGWERIPYPFTTYSQVGVRRQQATQDSWRRQYSGAQWATGLPVTNAMSVTIGGGFNTPTTCPCGGNQELYLNLVHDQGLLEMLNSSTHSMLSGYELGVYAGYDENGDPDPRNALWVLYRFNVPGFRVVASGSQSVRQFDQIALAYRDGTLSALHQRDGEPWRTVAEGRDWSWSDAEGKPAFYLTPGYSIDDATALTFVAPPEPTPVSPSRNG